MTLPFGEPRTYINRSGNQTTEWPDGRLRGGKKGVQPMEFAAGSNPTAHVIMAFDDLD